MSGLIALTWPPDLTWPPLTWPPLTWPPLDLAAPLDYPSSTDSGGGRAGRRRPDWGLQGAGGHR